MWPRAEDHHSRAMSCSGMRRLIRLIAVYLSLRSWSLLVYLYRSHSIRRDNPGTRECSMISPFSLRAAKPPARISYLAEPGTDSSECMLQIGCMRHRHPRCQRRAGSFLAVIPAAAQLPLEARNTQAFQEEIRFRPPARPLSPRYWSRPAAEGRFARERASLIHGVRPMRSFHASTRGERPAPQRGHRQAVGDPHRRMSEVLPMASRMLLCISSSARAPVIRYSPKSAVLR